MRTLLLACALALVAASTAAAGTVSGRIVFCDTGDECRYFGDPRLDVTYRAAPGKRDEIRVLPHPTGVRIVSKGIEAGPFCFTVNEYDARCGPPAPEGLLMVARTGDRADSGFTHIGSLILGSGDDVGIAYAASVFGGRGDDDLRGFGDGTLIVGGPGDDKHLATFGDQIIQGGPGNDFIYGGRSARRRGNPEGACAGGTAASPSVPVTPTATPSTAVRGATGPTSATTIASPAARPSATAAPTENPVRFALHVVPGRPAPSPSSPPSGGITRGGRLAANPRRTR